MDASRASDASDDDDRRDGDADDGVDAFGEVSGVGWSAASDGSSQALRGGDAVGPSSGQAAVGPAGHACARMAPTAALPDPKRLPTRLYTCKHAAHSQLGNDRARLQQLRTNAPESAKFISKFASCRAARWCRAGTFPRTGLCTQRDVPHGSHRLAVLRALAA